MGWSCVEESRARMSRRTKSLNGSMTRSFEPEPDLDPVLPDLAGSGLNQVQIRF